MDWYAFPSSSQSQFYSVSEPSLFVIDLLLSLAQSLKTIVVSC
jgi:hypothetical protein